MVSCVIISSTIRCGFIQRVSMGSCSLIGLLMVNVILSFFFHYQNSFLAGRNTSNDICVNQEALHSMMKMQDRQGAMLLKIELLSLWNGQVLKEFTP